MFIYVKYGDDQHFLANTNCSVLLLLHYARKKLGLRKKVVIDFCDEAGTMKLFFLMKTPGEYATKFLTPRSTYYICRVDRGAPGTRFQHAYRAFVPLIKNPEPEMLDALRTQCDMLERSRLKMLRAQEAKKVATIESTVNLPGKGTKSSTLALGQQRIGSPSAFSQRSKGRSDVDGSSRRSPLYKPRVGFSKKEKRR
ncbi:uncharacterized protein CXorf65 homolog [Ochotona princeps]|uniref:uncharacterized protein CXorf65 homolog n=1 Tax=Ochotona princeps TaxID=9978 RepID=UPI00271548B5|nr:uncharacterized protein CXorf65 homolog [Ochotona princeps]